MGHSEQKLVLVGSSLHDKVKEGGCECFSKNIEEN